MQVWAGPGIPHEKAAPVPAGWDYDMWLGQTPWYPFVPGRVNAWQYFWDTAEGVMTDMGCHYTDQMQWALDTDHTGPVEFEAQGELPDPAKFCSDTPITGVGRCKYANGVTGVMYQRGAFKDRYIRFIGDEGWIQVDDETDIVTAEPKSILSLKGASAAGWGDASDHVRNLLNCIRSRTPTICNPEVAHRAITICQAWTLSLRLGRKLKWDPVKERFDLEEANRMLYREPRAPWRCITTVCNSQSAIFHSMNTRLLASSPSPSPLVLASAASSCVDRPPEPTSPKLVAEAATYQPGQSREPFRRLEELVRQSFPRRAQASGGRPGAAARAQLHLRGAPLRLQTIGHHRQQDRACRPCAELLKSDETAGIACLALTTYPPGKADEILRAALPCRARHRPHPNH